MLQVPAQPTYCVAMDRCVWENGWSLNAKLEAEASWEAAAQLDVMRQDETGEAIEVKELEKLAKLLLCFDCRRTKWIDSVVDLWLVQIEFAKAEVSRCIKLESELRGLMIPMGRIFQTLRRTPLLDY